MQNISVHTEHMVRRDDSADWWSFAIESWHQTHLLWQKMTNMSGALAKLPSLMLLSLIHIANFIHNDKTWRYELLKKCAWVEKK